MEIKRKLVQQTNSLSFIVPKHLTEYLGLTFDDRNIIIEDKSDETGNYLIVRKDDSIKTEDNVKDEPKDSQTA